MHRQRKLQLSFLLIISLLLSSVSVAAQNTSAATSDWSSLRAVAVSSKLEVKLKSGKTFKGTLNSVSDDGLIVSSKTGSEDVKRADVLTVHQIKSKSATKATLIGAGVGAGAGAAIGAAGSSNDNNRFNFDKLDHAITAGLAVVGAAAGALTGYLVAKSGGKRVLIYKAQ